jgi:hypothetical protein
MSTSVLEKHTVTNLVTIDWVWIGNLIYWTLVTTSKDYAVTVLHTSQIAVGHGRCSLYAGFLNCPWPQLPASHSNGSQWLNPNGYITNWMLTVTVTLWLAVQCQSVHLGAKPLEDQDQRFFFFLQLNPCGLSPYITSSLMRRWVCLLWRGFAFVKCTHHTYSMLLKNLPCASYTSPVSRDFAEQIKCILSYATVAA